MVDEDGVWDAARPPKACWILKARVGAVKQSPYNAGTFLGQVASVPNKTLRQFAITFWALASPYWLSAQRLRGLRLLVGVVALALGLVWLEVQFNQWNNLFYNAIQDKDLAQFWSALQQFALLASALIAATVYRLYLEQMLQMTWRNWLTTHFLDQWLSAHAYYRLQLLEVPIDNPDQRIAEDLRLFVELTLSLTLGLLTAVLTLASFVVILWSLCEPLHLHLGVIDVVLQGDMVWAALIYAVMGTVLTHRIGRPLIGLHFLQQRVEADFRYALVRFRENTEAIAFYGGEAAENARFQSRYAQVLQNWWSIMRQQKTLTWFTAGYQQIALIFPLVIAAPRYFAGTLTLGGLMQIASAFGQVQSALSWCIEAYPRFTEWKATVDRLTDFTQALRAVQTPTSLHTTRRAGVRETHAGSNLHLEQLEVFLPQGRVLLAPTNHVLYSGGSVCIRGASGSGKSTLFRVLAGLWPYWQGRVLMPQAARCLFLPQRPYLPLGRLHEVLAYPSVSQSVDVALIDDVLKAVDLGHLSHIDQETMHWSQRLSGGEQQRLAFARAILQAPDWLFLDEAMSALPESTQVSMLALLRLRLPQVSLVSISHSAALGGQYTQLLEFVIDRDGQPQLVLVEGG